MPKKFTRKRPKKYPMVEVTLPDVYGDTPMRLPDQAALTIGSQRRLMKGDLDPLFEILSNAGVDQETMDAIEDLDQEETGEFMQVWRNASPVDPGKSAA